MDGKKSILTVGITRETFDEVAPPLLRRIFEIDWVPSAGAAIELASVVPISALLVNHRLQVMSVEDFVKAIRAPDSASKSAAIALITTSEMVEEASAFLDQGVDLLMCLDDPAGERETLLCTLLGIQPRRSMRVLVKLNVAIDNARPERFVAQTRDISETGMFVITRKRVPIGSQAQFELTLPDNPTPIRGLTKVVRHAVAALDTLDGMGLKFESFTTLDDACRLANHLEACNR